MAGRPRRIACADEEPSEELVQAARDALAAGGRIALPTETVYGVAARADSAEALEGLARLKGRDARQPLTWHVGERAALERFPRVSPLAHRLARRYWPGPLTLVLPGVPDGLGALAPEGWTGVRLPAQRGTAGILRALEFPVAATSANLHGHPPLVDAASVEEQLGDDLTLVLDGGRSRLAEASTVLRVGPGRFEVLREGLIGAAALRATAGLALGFVCTGNTCRSPMAAVLAAKVLAERLEVPPARLGEFGFSIVSMGLAAGSGSPAAEPARRAVAELDLDLSAHRSRAALDGDLEALDRVYAMTASHLDALTRVLPPSKTGHLELFDPSGADVPDPIGGTLDDYRRCRDRLLDVLARRVDEWA